MSVTFPRGQYWFRSYFLIRCLMPTSLAVLAFLIFTSVLIAGYFYMLWAKGRESVPHHDPD